MRMIMFVLFLLVAVAYALRRGGGPERAMAGIAIGMVLSDLLLHQVAPPIFEGLDLGHLAIDLIGAAATFTLAMVAYRFWPMIAAVLHILPLMAHTSRLLEIPVQPVAYLTMQVASSWLVPPLLIAATWRQQRRLTLRGSYPSWHISSRRSNRSAAKS